MNNINELYDFVCEVVQHDKEKPIIINRNIYRSNYMEFYKGSKTTKCTFTIVRYSNKYSAFVHAIDHNKKLNIQTEFKGNLLWGFGEPLSLNKLLDKINNYTNLDQVKKDFDL